MQRSERFTTHYHCFGVAGLAPNSFRVDVHKRVQLGIQSFDFRQMRIGEFDRGELLLADLLGHDNGGKESKIVHFVLKSPGRRGRV